MSVYVTLPSNGANLQTEQDLINNTKTDFIINFDHPLDLKYYIYEVALVEVWFPLDWKVNYGTLIFKYEEKLISIINLEWYDGINAQQLVNHLNSTINEENLISFNGILTNNLIKAFSQTHFELDNVGSLIIKLSSKIELTINGFLTDVLINPFIQVQENHFDFEEARKFLNKNIFINEKSLKIIGSNNVFAKFDFLVNSFNIIKEIFVYTNIIDYQYVGQTTAQLLSVVSVNKEFNNTCHTIFVSPHYLPVIDNKIESIRIFMRDSIGNKIKFSSFHSNVIYKLHFKPRTI